MKAKIIYCKAEYFNYVCTLMYVQRYTIEMLKITFVVMIYRMKPEFPFQGKIIFEIVEDVSSSQHVQRCFNNKLWRDLLSEYTLNQT